MHTFFQSLIKYSFERPVQYFLFLKRSNNNQHSVRPIFHTFKKAKDEQSPHIISPIKC